jgi:hypothetical protein
MNLPILLKLGSGQAKDVQQHRRPSTPNASPLAELCKPSTILKGQLASIALFALVWDMPSSIGSWIGPTLRRRLLIGQFPICRSPLEPFANVFLVAADQLRMGVPPSANE